MENEMNRKKLIHAVAEANRFIARANELFVADSSQYFNCQPKETGAVRRASMDLTRALAELRKPG